MKEKFYALLNLNSKEFPLVFEFMVLQFFIAIATSFLNTVSYTLFLQTFPISQLPIAYLATAIVLLVFSRLYQKFEHQLSPLDFIRRILLLSLSVLILIWFGLLVTENNQSLVFLLLIFNNLVYMLLGSAFWGLPSLLFNVRESKRFFFLIGSGDIPSKLIGYLSVSALAPFIGAEALLGFSLAGFVLAAFYINRSGLIKNINWRNFVHEAEERHIQPSIVYGRQLIKRLFHSELIVSLSALSLLSYFAYTLIDFTFLSQIKLAFSEGHALTSFIALFFGLGRAASLLVKLILSSRVIAKLGLMVSLLIIPVTLTVMSLFILFFPDGNTALYVFGIMALFAEVLRSLIQEPVLLILFQPLRPALRLKGHAMAKIYMPFFALFSAGILLALAFHFQVPLSIENIAFLLIGIFVVWVLVISIVKKAYLKTLNKAIAKGFFPKENTFVLGEYMEKMLLEKVHHGSDLEAVNAFELLEKSKFKGLINLYLEKLDRADDFVKLFIIKQLKNQKNLACLPQMYSLLEQENSAEVKKEILRALCTLDENFAENNLADFERWDLEIKKEILLILLKKDDLYGFLAASNLLVGIMNSTDSDERVAALEIIIGLGKKGANKIIDNYIKDADARVRGIGLEVIAKLKIKEKYGVLFTACQNENDKYAAMKALLLVGEDLFDMDVLAEFNYCTEIIDSIIKIAEKSEGEKSSNFLLKQLKEVPDRTPQVINALWRKNYKPNYGSKGELKAILEQLLPLLRSKLNLLSRLQSLTNVQALLEAITREIRTDLVTCLKISSMLYDTRKINRVLEIVDFHQSKRVSNAIEMLEMIIPEKYFKELNYALDFVMESNIRFISQKAGGLEAIINDILEAPDNNFNKWTKSVCFYIAGKNRFKDLLKKFKFQAVNDERLVKETREWALSCI